jgi:hypothetical protein
MSGGARSKVGLEVMPITSVTQSDGHCPRERAPSRRYGGKSERSGGCAICLCKECSARPIPAQVSRRCCIAPGQVGISCSLLVNNSPLSACQDSVSARSVAACLCRARLAQDPDSSACPGPVAGAAGRRDRLQGARARAAGGGHRAQPGRMGGAALEGGGPGGAAGRHRRACADGCRRRAGTHPLPPRLRSTGDPGPQDAIGSRRSR